MKKISETEFRETAYQQGGLEMTEIRSNVPHAAEFQTYF